MDLSSENVVAEVVNTDVKADAEFSTSNPLMNQINTIWRRSLEDNLHGGVMSDCPHREKSPYTGDGQVCCETVMANYDCYTFYHKWLRDMRDAQNVETGHVPNSAPWQPGCGGGVGWGEVMNGGFGMVIDGTDESENHIKDMLLWDVNNGIARRSWARNEGALNAIKREMERTPGLRVTLPNLADEDIIREALK